MSWCVADRVVWLIHTARLDPNASPSNRKAADLELIDACTHSINVGDVLFSIALEDTQSFGVRMNAAMAAESLITQRGWVESALVSDKDAVLRSLVAWLSSSTAAQQGQRKLVDVLVRCLGQVVVLEYRTEPWTQYLSSTMSAAITGCCVSRQILHHLASVSFGNFQLWCFMANHLCRMVLDELVGRNASFRVEGLTFMLLLMKKRCRPTQEGEVANANNCLLLSRDMTQYIMAEVEAVVAEASARANNPTERSAYFMECDVLLSIAQRLIVDEACANVVFQCASFFLVNLQPMYAASVLAGEEVSEEVVQLADNSLECLISVLQACGEVAQSVRISQLLETLLVYLVPTHTPTEVPEVESRLTEYLSDDEVTPLGCGGGDVPALAVSVLEAYLENAPSELSEAACCIVQLAGMLHQEAANEASASPQLCGRIHALGKAMSGVARYAQEANEASLVDLLASSDATQLLSHCTTLLLHSMKTSAYSSACFLDALSHCFHSTQDPNKVLEFLSFLDSVFTHCTSDSTNESRAVVQMIAIYASGVQLTSEVAGQYLPVDLCATWLSRAMQSLHQHPTTFAAYCCCTAMRAALAANPAVVGILRTNVELFTGAINILCGCCQLKCIAAVLLQLLKLFGRHSASDGGESCQLMRFMAQLVLSHCGVREGRSALVARTVAELIVSLSKESFGGAGRVCMTCLHHMCEESLQLLLVYATQDGPHDDSASRLLATSFFYMVTMLRPSKLPFEVLQSSAQATMMLLQLDRSPEQTASTVSAIAINLSLQSICSPYLLDGDFSGWLWSMFSRSQQGHDKGIFFVGPSLLVSLLTLRNPMWILQRVDASAAHDHGWVPGVIAGLWCSVAVLVDRFALQYFFAAVLRLFSLKEAWSSAAQRLMHAPLANCVLYQLPTLNTPLKKAPKLRQTTMASCVKAALEEVQRRWKTTLHASSGENEPLSACCAEKCAAAIMGTMHAEEMSLILMDPPAAAEALLAHLASIAPSMS